MTDDANGRGLDVDVKALVRQSRRAERTVPICLRDDLVAQFEELDRELAAALAAVGSNPADARLNNTRPAAARAIAEQMAALQEQMRESTILFRVRAMGPKRWAALRAEHPPRKGDDGKVVDSDLMGVNAATFFEPLVRQSVVWPKLDDDDWQILLNGRDNDKPDDEDTAGLSDGQFDQLANAAWSVNRGDVDIPFSRAASRILQSFGSN